MELFSFIIMCMKMKILMIIIMIWMPTVEKVGATDDEKNDDNVKEESKDRIKIEQIERFERIVKPPHDSRAYRALKLSNGLKIMLISDRETDKSAACMTVGVGSMHDYRELPGLAHLLEHMLFMGSEKYPEENYFSTFIWEHGGEYNGTTYENSQKFYWDIDSYYLAKALDIMSQFFLTPSMDPSCLAGEVQAVDSEHRMTLTNDEWRLQQLERTISKPRHPYARFPNGNLKSLDKDPKDRRINVRKKLLELYKTRYSSNIMYLAVLGKESLDELEAMIVPEFAKIKNKKRKKTVYAEHPWGPGQLMRKIRLQSIADIRLLRLRFPMPDVEKHYKTAPLHYILTLIGHEGPGSIFSELKRRNWVESLDTGYDVIPGFTFFDIDIHLTEEAMSHVDEIIQLVFQYVYLLKKKGPQEWFFNELKEIDATTFKYAEQLLPIDLVQFASSAMMKYPFEDILSRALLHDKWIPSLISEYLDYLKPKNFNIFISSQSFEEVENETLIEPWYRTKYNVEWISDYNIDEMWNIKEPFDKFHLPPANEFIAHNFSIYPLGKNFWFKQDDEFKLPRMSIQLNLYTPITCLHLENINLINVFVSLFEDEFTEYAYAATLAGLEWSIDILRCAIQFELYGYNEKLPLLLRKLISTMINFKPDEKKFENLKESRARKFKNFATEQPETHGDFYLSHLLNYSYFAKHENMAAAKSLRFDDMRKFVKRLFSRVFIHGFIYGNCNEEVAMNIVSVIENQFRSSSVVLPQELGRVRGSQMDDGSSVIYKAPHKYSTSSCYYGYFQIGFDYPIANIVVADLFDEIVSEKCFDVLRTQEHLGYIAECEIRKEKGVISFRILLQSEKHPVYLDSRAEEFLRNLDETIEDMTEEDVDVYKRSLRNKYLEKMVSPQQKSLHYWAEISARRYLFDESNVKAELLAPLRKKNISDFYEEYIRESTRKRRKLAVYVISQLTEPELPEGLQSGGSDVEDVIAFRSSLASFPEPMPCIETHPLGLKV